MKRLLCGLALAVVLWPSLAQAQRSERTDLDCRDFPTRAAARAALARDPSDPNRLDRDRDGDPCEHLPDGPSMSIGVSNGATLQLCAPLWAVGQWPQLEFGCVAQPVRP